MEASLVLGVQERHLKFEHSTSIEGVAHIHLDRHRDSRGYFVETFRQSWFPAVSFAQANLSSSEAGVLRGLHYHLRQEDLWLIPSGRAFVALVDLRQESSTYLSVEEFRLEGARAVLIPIGVAHGFYAETDILMSYLVTREYDGTDEHGVAWDDPGFQIHWPSEAPRLSQRDEGNLRWKSVADGLRP